MVNVILLVVGSETGFRLPSCFGVDIPQGTRAFMYNLAKIGAKNPWLRVDCAHYARIAASTRVRPRVVSKLTIPGGLVPEMKVCDFWDGSRCGEYL